MRMLRAGVLIVLVWAWMAGCATRQNADARIRGALDVVARVVDPAYALGVDACIAREAMIAAAAESREVPIGQADTMLREVRTRCQQMRLTFDAIRKAHTRAGELVERGAIDEAQKQLEHIEQLWVDIKEGAMP